MIKDEFLRIFTWLIFIPIMTILSWYGVYKLVMWMFNV